MKDFLVHLNVSRHCRARVQIAARLVQAFGGHLTGLFTSAVSDVPFYMMEETDLDAGATMRAWWLRARDKAKAAFDEGLRESGVSAEWLEVDDRDGSAVARHARCADLTIVGQLDPEELLPRPEYRIPERVALDSGGPVLVVPYAGTFETVGRRVLIAWNGSAQAARAVRDALPLVSKADAVTVLEVKPERRAEATDERATHRIAAHLARHGIRASLHEVVADDIAVGEIILCRVADEGADLLVMGAYGHARASELLLGGVTRTLFKQMTVPTLMAH